MSFNPVLTTKQTRAWDFLEKPDIREILFGGAKYGGKSWFLCVWSYSFALSFADKFKIPKSDNPLPIGFLGRKVAKNFSDTTLETWFKTIPANGYVARGKPVELIIDNRVKLHTGGLDNRETINKFNSAEYAFFAIDQAEETTEDDISLLRAATFGRLVVQNKAVDGKGLFTANPRICWLKDEFIENPAKSRRFVSALPTDNPYCSQAYIDNLKDAFKHRPELLRAYLYGDWSGIEGVNQVIRDVWLERALRMPSLFMGKVISCDVARFGDDKTIALVLEGTEIVERLEMVSSRTTAVSDALVELSKRHSDCEIVVDEIGVGGGVVDELHKSGRRVISFNSSNKAENPEKFYNLRAEAWWMVGEHFAHGEIGCRKMSPELRKQLTVPCYDFRNGKIIIEPKDAIKERLGSSPDEADSFIMGVWAVKRVRPRVQYQNYGQSTAYRNDLLTHSKCSGQLFGRR